MQRALSVLATCILLGGCAEMLATAASISTGSFAYGSNEQPIDPTMTSYMPWQLGPSSPKTKAAHDEPIITASVPGWGAVKGRADVLAQFPTSLARTPGRNRTVEVCQQQAETAARRYNPTVQVEAASTRAERRLPTGNYRGQVRVRIIYSRPELHEVREAVMECTTTPQGRFVQADVVWPT